MDDSSDLRPLSHPKNKKMNLKKIIIKGWLSIMILSVVMLAIVTLLELIFPHNSPIVILFQNITIIELIFAVFYSFIVILIQ